MRVLPFDITFSATFCGYQPQGSFYFTIPPRKDISDQFSEGLWASITIGRVGRRGFGQKAFFLEKGIAEGKLSNSYPFILDESYCQEAGALVRRDQVELHAPPRPKSPPGPPPKATPSAPSTASSSFVNPYLTSSDNVTPVTSVPAERSTEEESSTRAKAKAKFSASSSSARVATDAPEQRILEYRPRFGQSQLIYKLHAGQTNIRDVVQFQLGDKPLSQARVLLLDWHQCVDRSPQGTTFNLGRVPTDNIRFLANCIEAADRANRAFFIVILSYIDTDRRLQEVLGYVNNSAGISTFVSFLLITRTERVGEKGKCSAVQDLLDQTGLCESQIFFVDDTCEVITEFYDCTPQISLAHIKLGRKPSVGRSVPQAKFLADTLPLIQEWLQR